MCVFIICEKKKTFQFVTIFFPILFQVHGGSLAEKAGLRVGDALIRVNNTDIYQLRHKDAQDAVSRAGNNFELVVSRSVWLSLFCLNSLEMWAQVRVLATFCGGNRIHLYIYLCFSIQLFRPDKKLKEKKNEVNGIYSGHALP